MKLINIPRQKRVNRERIVRKAICDFLKLVRIVHSVTDATQPFGPDGTPRRSKVHPGWPDIVGVLAPQGRFLGIEVKTSYGRVSTVQRATLDALANSGAIVGVCRNVDDVARLLTSNGYHWDRYTAGENIQDNRSEMCLQK